MQKPFLRLLIYLCLLLSVTETFAQDERLETARRHLVRGTAAIEVAKSSSDLQAAAQEFRKATELAPEMAAAWFNLGAVESKLKRYAEAIAAYQRYLQLNPKAQDGQKVQDEIVKLEFHKEREEKRQGIAGTWITFSPVKLVSGEGDYFYNSLYKATLDGDIVRLEVSDPRLAQRETVVFSNTAYEGFKRDSPWGWANVGGDVDSVFIGRLDGDRIVGERIRSAFLDKTTTCKVDEHRTPFEARFEDDGKTLVISYKEPRYSLLWDYVSMFNATTICSSVVPEQAEQMEFRLTQSAGNVGILDVSQESNGRPWKVEKILGAELMAGSGWRRTWSSAENVGIKQGDEILTINGRETKKMYNGEVLGQLIGPIGQTVRLTLNRKGWDSPVDLNLVFGAVPLPGGKPLGKGLAGVIFDSELRSNQSGPSWRHLIEEVVAGGAAEIAGVKPGGEIKAIDGKELQSLPYQDVRALLRGAPGTEVKLTVKQLDGNKTEYSLVRQEEKTEQK